MLFGLKKNLGRRLSFGKLKCHPYSGREEAFKKFLCLIACITFLETFLLSFPLSCSFHFSFPARVSFACFGKERMKCKVDYVSFCP